MQSTLYNIILKRGSLINTHNKNLAIVDIVQGEYFSFSVKRKRVFIIYFIPVDDSRRWCRYNIILLLHYETIAVRLHHHNGTERGGYTFVRWYSKMECKRATNREHNIIRLDTNTSGICIYSYGYSGQSGARIDPVANGNAGALSLL